MKLTREYEIDGQRVIVSVEDDGVMARDKEGCAALLQTLKVLANISREPGWYPSGLKTQEPTQ